MATVLARRDAITSLSLSPSPLCKSFAWRPLLSNFPGSLPPSVDDGCKEEHFEFALFGVGEQGEEIVYFEG